jgi:hypothetical protein
MIEVENEKISSSGPWVAEFGSWDRIGVGGITEEDVRILDGSSPELNILKCELVNIHPDKLGVGVFYNIRTSDGDIQTWKYGGKSRISPGDEFVFFSRPKDKKDWTYNNE